MTREEELELYRLTKENNIMLKAIIKYLANEARNHNSENIEDFIRNIIANKISDLSFLKPRP